MKPSFEKYIPFKQINLPDRQWPNNGQKKNMWTKHLSGVL